MNKLIFQKIMADCSTVEWPQQQTLHTCCVYKLSMLTFANVYQRQGRVEAGGIHLQFSDILDQI